MSPKRSAFSVLQDASRLTDGGTKGEKQRKLEANVREGDAAMKSYLLAESAKAADNFLVCVISKGRPKNVAEIARLFSGTEMEPAWIVGVGETEAYTSHGAKLVVEGGGLCASRNAAIELAATQGKFCVEMSDDISEIKILHQEGTWERPVDVSAGNALAKEVPSHRVSPVTAARYIELEMRRVGAKLGGAYPTANEGQAMLCAPTSTDNFIVGDFLVIDPSSSPRFDERMSLKEDYDLTAQHLHTYKAAARSNRTLVKATHYTNAGGAVAARDDAREQYNIGVLRYKWPGVFPQHGTRGPNEVRMAWAMRGTLLDGKKNVPRPPPPAGYLLDSGEKGGNLPPPPPPATKKRTIMSFFGKKTQSKAK